MIFSRFANTAVIAVCAGIALAEDEAPIQDTIVPSDLEHEPPVVADIVVPEPQPDGDRRRNVLPPGELGQIIDLTPEQKQEFVDVHNWWRNEAALGNLNGGKKGKQMPKLYWDDELADHAKRYSHQCVWEHSRPQGWGDLPYSYGENLYAGWGGGRDEDGHIAAAMSGWAEEHVGYNHDTRQCTIPMCGHYTAMVWEETTRVGCALTLCDTVSGLSSDVKRYYVICQYYTAGNYPRVPYTYDTTTGGGCSEGAYGATGLDLEFPGLCNSPNDICGRDNRCSAMSDCTPNEPLNGEPAGYECGTPRCHYDEFNDVQIRNPYTWGNGMRDSNGDWVYLQNRKDCEDWCYLNFGCEACTQASNQPSSIWFPVGEGSSTDRESAQGMTISVLDCSEPGASPVARPTEPPLPTPMPTISPTVPDSFDCSVGGTISGQEVRFPWPSTNGLTDSAGQWQYCWSNPQPCIEWCMENAFTAPCAGVTSNSQNPNFYFPVKTIDSSQRTSASGGSIVPIECTAGPAPVADPTDAPTNAPLPTNAPTNPPTNPPSAPPTNPPTENPTVPPTNPPTNPPTENPTVPPTNPPTDAPTVTATPPPTDAPTSLGTLPPNPPTNSPTSASTPPPTPTSPPVASPSVPPTVFTGVDPGCGVHTDKRQCRRTSGCRFTKNPRSCKAYTCSTAKSRRHCEGVQCTWSGGSCSA